MVTGAGIATLALDGMSLSIQLTFSQNHALYYTSISQSVKVSYVAVFTLTARTICISKCYGSAINTTCLTSVGGS